MSGGIAVKSEAVKRIALGIAIAILGLVIAFVAAPVVAKRYAPDPSTLVFATNHNDFETHATPAARQLQAAAKCRTGFTMAGWC